MKTHLPYFHYFLCFWYYGSDRTVTRSLLPILCRWSSNMEYDVPISILALFRANEGLPQLNLFLIFSFFKRFSVWMLDNSLETSWTSRSVIIFLWILLIYLRWCQFSIFLMTVTMSWLKLLYEISCINLVKIVY